MTHHLPGRIKRHRLDPTAEFFKHDPDFQLGQMQAYALVGTGPEGVMLVQFRATALDIKGIGLRKYTGITGRYGAGNDHIVALPHKHSRQFNIALTNAIEAYERIQTQKFIDRSGY